MIDAIDDVSDGWAVRFSDGTARHVKRRELPGVPAAHARSYEFARMAQQGRKTVDERIMDRVAELRPELFR